MRVRRPTGAEWLVGGIIGVIMILLAVVSLQSIRWVGRTDLEVEFVITDSATGESIPGAAVEIHSEGGLFEEREAKDFQLVTGLEGKVAHLCRESMCFGTHGLFTDTYVVHLPWWLFRVTASGYEPTAFIDLDVLEYRRAVVRMDPRRAKLVVPISLHKKPE